MKAGLDSAIKDVKGKSKALKEKEKENYNLEQKNLNLAENEKKFKCKLNSCKSEVKKLDKQLKSKLKKSPQKLQIFVPEQLPLPL